MVEQMMDAQTVGMARIPSEPTPDFSHDVRRAPSWRGG
jgi:hypothetical protein